MATLRTIRHRRRGIIFITALWITVLLAGMVLVLCHSMTTETLASGNRMNYAQVDAIERGAEQYVLCQVDGCRGDALTVTQAPAEAMPLGGGYFWILRPWPDNDQDYGFGIADEAAKINLNTATYQQLQNLPNVSTDMAAAIFSWSHDPATGGKVTNAAESDFYTSLSDFPYNAKNYAFDTVEETLLVRDVTKEVLFGADANRDGYTSPDELTQANNNQAYSSAQNAVYTDTRGMFPFVTVSTTDPNLDVSGNKRVNVNDFNALSTYLKNKSGMDQAVVTQILRRLQGRYGNTTGVKNSTGGATALGTTGATGTTATVFPNLQAFYEAAQFTPSDMAKVFDSLTASKTAVKGLVNVNTAPQQVLQTLPTLEQSDAQSIVAQRSSDTQGGAGAGWVFKAITDKNKAYQIADKITGESYQYSADIVAVSSDGKTFKRVRIIVDGSKSPAVITYRRDLTSYGWPLKPEIRQQMKEGKFVSNANGNEPSQGQLDNGLNSLQ